MAKKIRCKTVKGKVCVKKGKKVSCKKKKMRVCK
jgi:hypothetical protein